MNKSLLVKIGIAAFLLAGFAGYNAYTKWSNTHFKVDPKAFNIVSNLKSIIDDEFKGFPPLKSAYQHHLLEDVNQSIALPNIRREIKVHKIWFIFPKMYVLYSLNLHKNDKGTKDIPRLRFPSMTFMVNGKELEASITPSDLPSEEKGKVFNGRLYRGVLLTPNFEDILTEDFRFNQFLKNLKAVQLKDPKLVTPNSKKKDNEIPIKGLELTFRHNIDKYQLFEVPLNKKFKLDNGQQLIFKKFTAGVRVNKLFYTLKGKNKSNIFFLNIRETQSSLPADLPIQFQMSRITKLENGLYSVNLNPMYNLADVHDQLQIQFSEVGSFNKGFQFTIPASMNAKSREVATIYDTTYSFVKYLKQARGQVGLQLKWNKTGLPNKKKVLTNGFPILYRNLPETVKNVGQKPTKFFRSYLEVRNEKGKLPDKLISLRNRNSHSYYMTLLMNQSFLERSEKITVIFHNIPYIHKLKPTTLSINIPNKGF